MLDGGVGVIGTYEEAIGQIQRLWDQSDGGFGCYLNLDHNWADFRANRHNYHLFANHVMPYFQGGNNDDRRWRAIADSSRAVPFRSRTLTVITAARC